MKIRITEEFEDIELAWLGVAAAGGHAADEGYVGADAGRAGGCGRSAGGRRRD
jgi:hypothetical protein